MNRGECEKAIIERLKEIVDIYHQYNQNGEYLSLTYIKDQNDGDYIRAENEYWSSGKDYDTPLEVSIFNGEKVQMR